VSLSTPRAKAIFPAAGSNILYILQWLIVKFEIEPAA